MSFWPYLGILAAAALEGEVVYVAAVVAASLGRLNPFGVLVSGSFGGWAGDQFWYYAARGPLSSWLNKFENIARRRRAMQERMHRHATKLILAVRFLPGLRIAIPVACAYSGVAAITFSGLSLISAIAWAAAIMLIVLQLGPTSMSALGIKAWWAPVIPAAIVILFFRWLSRSGAQGEPPVE
ncbi:MAG TPA: VTT domain-containing protein [Terriglobia bacterium]|jgi:membrane protein DedA with SNARE-associated domain